MVRIILIRHGETNWNLQGRYQGQEDTRLSEKGFAQAGLLAQGLKNVHLDLCISSPLKRSFLTCKACADLKPFKTLVFNLQGLRRFTPFAGTQRQAPYGN